MDRRRFLQLAACLPLALLCPIEPAHSREIVLLETAVAGWRYYEGDSVWSALRPGDVLELRREPANPYDGMAIAIYGAGVKLGYIPRDDNAVIANIMDQGRQVRSRVLHKNPSPHPWERMEIQVTLA